jgi:hypothetical protein
MTQRFSRLVLLILAVFAPIIAFGDVQTKPSAPELQDQIRLQRDAAGIITALQVAITHFYSVSDKAILVDLVGAVHVGEKGYYDELNRRFKQYDVVLYELIAPPDHDVTKRDNVNPVSLLQNGLKELLGLRFQLDEINYKASNFVHADLSPEDFVKSMQARGESFSQLFLKLMVEAYLQQMNDPEKAQGSGLLLALSFFSENRTVLLKRNLATQLVDMERTMTALGGNDGSTIITVRNTRALKVLKEQLARGKKKIAIFYGAGHFGDMEQQLLKTFGLKPQGQEWLNAWEMPEPKQ